MRKTVKHPDVAGFFYQANPNELRETVQDFLDQAKETDKVPKAIVAPHAGYIYSGPVAATAYKSLFKIKDNIKNIILLSPAHHYPLTCMATHDAEFFETPLGKIQVNRKIVESINKFDQVETINAAFNKEHALEVHLPFIQTIFDNVQIVPMVVGHVSQQQVAQVLEALWDNQENLFIISSDLSHFNTYEEANIIDQKTSASIEKLDFNSISPDQACGYYPLGGLLKVAKDRNLKAYTLELKNSGDTQGDRSRVVGYGAYIICEQ